MRYLVVLLLLFLVSCDQPTSPELDPEPPDLENPPDEDPPTDDVPDVIFDPLTGDSLVVTKTGAIGDGSFGDLSFRTRCGTCHASRNGLDIAFFNFSDEDIIRRGVVHVDTATVLAIRDYIRSIQANLTTVDRETELFRPGSEKLASDRDVAITLFGKDAWPRNLTVEELQSIDPRDIALSVPFPTWSSESTENDWVAETPLDASILSAQGELVRSRLVAYYETRSDVALRHLVDDFEQVATQPGFACEGTPGFHPRPLACFEARRWMASLTAMHLIQQGITRSVPEYIADLWWRVGEAGVSWSLGPGNPASSAERLRRRRVTNSWLTLSWIYDPARVGDNEAYLSEFTKHTDERRQVALAYAYWLTTEPTAQEGQQVYLVALQMFVPFRLPDHWYVDYTNWMLDVVNQFLDEGIMPQTPEALDTSIQVMANAVDLVRSSEINAPAAELSAIRARLQTLTNRLEGLR
ncbi:MAG TPA: hypothetical protein VKP65_05115 [Rhodothermales bacterium]|nr:hypothetical protein [Rhodothermales bacterium]